MALKHKRTHPRIKFDAMQLRWLLYNHRIREIFVYR